MSACETRIPVSKDTRQKIRIVRAHEDLGTYDETLAALVDAFEGEEGL